MALLDPIVSVLSVSAIILLIRISRRIFPKSPLTYLPGPKSPSWILGNLAEYLVADAGEKDFEWARLYGSTYRVNAGYGEEALLTSDPKALQFILQTSGYDFVRPPDQCEQAALFFGENHTRHRRVMLPGFGESEIKALSFIFQATAKKVSDIWREKLLKNTESAEIDIHDWLAKATLDVIGKAAFDYEFGALEESNNRLAANFKDMLMPQHMHAQQFAAVVHTIRLLPAGLMSSLMTLPLPFNKRMIQNLEVSSSIAGELLTAKAGVQGTDQENKDIMSLLIKSNSSTSEKSKLSDEEMIGQLNSIIFAGHETTANTLTWAVWEMVKRPEIQQKLRKEIRELTQLEGYQDDEPIALDKYEKMPYMMSFIKEAMRFHTIVPRLNRQAARDIVVPLSEPIKTLDGRVVNEVVMKKGQLAFGSLVHYNRRKDLWGVDADTFRPERWLDMVNPKVKFGVHSNLASFGGGAHACIGYRFVLYETQAFLIELLDNFDFDATDETISVRRIFAGVMLPVAPSDTTKTCMPVRISLANKEGSR